jgi:hypothetical protein
MLTLIKEGRREGGGVRRVSNDGLFPYSVNSSVKMCLDMADRHSVRTLNRRCVSGRLLGGRAGRRRDTSSVMLKALISDEVSILFQPSEHTSNAVAALAAEYCVFK